MAETVQMLITDANVLVAAAVALAAGIVSFASPCVLPLVPGYLSFMSGLSGSEIVEGQIEARGRLLLGSVLFVLGFGVPFMLLGAFASELFFDLQQEWWARILMGGIVAVLGILMATGRLTSEYRVSHVAPDRGVLSAPILGFVFGVGWTPCVGPALGAIITLSSTTGGAVRGGFLGMVYALGIGLPFILFALLFKRLAGTLDFLKRHARKFQIAGGGLIALVGIAIATGAWNWFITQLRPLIGGFETAI
ncbi:MAG: cytochrome c biogenesis protein CcdA [Nitriliruptorales bacterium]|nr:cytochrome c biogenesis protein CcdA [Nitriliruptorales bacterium]